MSDPVLAKAQREMKAFRTIPQAEMFMGVCAGLAYRLAVPTWIIRVILVLLVLCAGVGLLAYLLVGFLAPEADALPSDYEARTGDNLSST